MALYRCSSPSASSSQASGYEDFDGVSEVTIPLDFEPKMVCVICRDNANSNVLFDLWTRDVFVPPITTNANFLELTQTYNGGSKSYYTTALGSGARGLVTISTTSPYSIKIKKPASFGNVAYWYAAG